jgi:TolB-like protein/Tfp pilus assembly protein PilF
MSGQAPESRVGPEPSSPPASVQPQPNGTKDDAPHIAAPAHSHHLRISFRFLEQLKQRNVIRVAILYLVACWLILEPVYVVFHMLEVPPWANRLVVVLMAIGFPSVLLFAWVYEITPEGLKPTVEVEPSRSIRKQTGQRLNRAIFAVMGMALAYFVVDKFWPPRPVAVSEHASDATRAAEAAMDVDTADKTIAVLPFVDLSEKKDQEYFADGMAEEIIDLLATVPNVKVIGRTSSFQFKGKNTDLREVGKALGTANVLQGSVRRSQDRVRVNVQLIDTRDGSHRWSESYDRPIGDVLKVQDDIAAGLVRAIQVQVGAADLPARTTVVNPKAYSLFLRARAARDRQDIQGQEDALRYYGQALKVDPTFVPAAAGVARASIAIFNYTRTERDASQARAAIDAALMLDPNLPEMHGLRAWLYMNDGLNWAAAEAETQQALRMDPENHFIQMDAGVLACALGRWDEAMRYFRAALSHDPFNSGMINHSASCLLRSGHLVEAEEQIRHALAISPTNDPGWAIFGRVLLARGELSAALDAFRHTTWRHNRLVGLTAVYYAMGRRAESEQTMRQLEAEAAAEAPYEVAQGRAYRGEFEEALKWLERAGAQKNVDVMITAVKGDPAFARYTGDPRYRAWLRKLNLPD